jgi:hypothetical protein
VPGPSAERVAELAPFWESVSIHEAGHAVVGVLLGVPVHHVRLDYQPTGFLGSRWEVSGYTGIGSDGRSAVLDEKAAVLFTLAGLEAEALFISGRDHIALRHAQAEVESRRASRGDLRTITACLPDSGLTLDEASFEAHCLVIDHWSSIENVAAFLRDHRYMPGFAVARLA